MTLWLTVAVASAGCAMFKLAGYSVPSAWLQRGAARSVLEAVPVALLSALVAVATLAGGTRLVLESRAVGVLVAVALVAVRAPFVVVVVAACGAAAAAHALR